MLDARFNRFSLWLLDQQDALTLIVLTQLIYLLYFILLCLMMFYYVFYSYFSDCYVFVSLVQLFSQLRL